MPIITEVTAQMLKSYEYPQGGWLYDACRRLYDRRGLMIHALSGIDMAVYEDHNQMEWRKKCSDGDF
jgi:hypothetical protein